MTGVVRPVEVQGAFASPAIIALASLFVIAYAMELAGPARSSDPGRRPPLPADRRGRPVGPHRPRRAAPPPFSTTRRSSCSARRSSATSPASLGLSPQRFLIPLVLHGGARRLLHPDRHLDQPAGQRHGARSPGSRVRHFRDHAGRPRGRRGRRALSAAVQPRAESATGARRTVSPRRRRHRRTRITWTSAAAGRLRRAVRRTTAAAAAQGAWPRSPSSSASSPSRRSTFAPIAACAFAGAVLLILLRVITADEAYSGLRPEV